MFVSYFLVTCMRLLETCYIIVRDVLEIARNSKKKQPFAPVVRLAIFSAKACFHVKNATENVRKKIIFEINQCT
jgi:hypothetical protein